MLEKSQTKIKMMKNTLIIILFLSNLCFAQSHRFIYEYKFVSDSTKRDSIIVENTRLEIFNDHSEFLSDVTAKKDSAIATAAERKESPANINLEDGKYRNKTYKSKNLVYTIDYIGIQPFKVIRNPKLKWSLSHEKRIIEGYNCQKATVNFGNRQWEAWFSEEIPVPEGPYLFNGLPGLIVKIGDTSNQHSFLLVANYKTTSSKTNMTNKPYLVPTEISEILFNKKWNEFRKNPIGGTEQFMILNPGLLSGERFDKNGNKLDFRQGLREEKKYTEKLIKKNNNFLDLQLYK